MSGQVEDAQYALVGARRIDAGDVAALTAIVRRRARDRDDAALLLDALGLLGDCPPAKSNTVAYVHGTQSGVDWHVDKGHVQLCGACQRWAEVRGGRVEGEQRCGPAVGTARGYWRHKSARPRQEAYRVYQLEQAALKREAR